MTRPKSFLTYFVSARSALLLLAGLNYWTGIRTVDSTVSTIVQVDLNSLNVTVDNLIGDQERSFLSLTSSPSCVRSLLKKNVAEDHRLSGVRISVPVSEM